MHKLIFCVACSAKTDQERAAWNKLLLCWWSLCQAPEASRTTFQYFSKQHVGCQYHRSPGKVKTQRKSPERKAVQPETVCTLILSSLIYCLVSFSILYYEEWMLLSMWLLLLVTGVERIILSGDFYVCLNYPAQCAYMLLLLPCCIQWGHIDPQVSPLTQFP